jgi:hypothetical protein
MSKKLKILCFNHHPDVLHYMWRAFTDLGHEVHVATEDLALNVGFKYSSTKDNKFEVVDQLFEPKDLFSDMETVVFSDRIDSSYDITWAMLPEILTVQRPLTPWFDCQMQGFLNTPSLQRHLSGIKTANHPDAESYGFRFCPNWVAEQPAHIESKYIVQLITELDMVDTTPELKKLKERGLPVRIHGGSKCPDGFIRDIDILPHAGMVVHNKQFGINCYVILKALNMGIPVYLSKKTKTMIGFDDLPDEIFLFQEDYTIEQAWSQAESADHGKIKTIFDSIYTLERTKKHVNEIINAEF